jgi:hypothetical protein
MRPICTIVQTLVVALAMGLFAATSAEAFWVLTPNLVANPGAELGGSGQGGVVTSIPGWRREAALGSKMSTVVDYGAPGFPTLAQSAGVGGGSHFFAGGPADGHDDNTSAFSRAVLDQTIYLVNLDEDVMRDIKEGHAYAIVSACLGGYATQDDRVDMRVTVVGDEDLQVTLRGPSANERHGTTGLLPRTAMLWLPPEADTLAVELDFERASGEGTYADGYADNISVRLGRTDGTEPEPSCAFDAPPAPGASAPSPGSPAAAKPVPGGSAAADSSSTGGTNTAVPLRRVGNRIRFRHGAAALKLRCAARDGACAGSVSLKTRLGRLGSARFRIGAGKVGTVQVRIGRTMRHRLAALSRARLAKLDVIATARIGAAATTFVYRAAP